MASTEHSNNQMPDSLNDSKSKPAVKRESDFKLLHIEDVFFGRFPDLYCRVVKCKFCSKLIIPNTLQDHYGKCPQNPEQEKNGKSTDLKLNFGGPDRTQVNGICDPAKKIPKETKQNSKARTNSKKALLLGGRRHGGQEEVPNNFQDDSQYSENHSPASTSGSINSYTFFGATDAGISVLGERCKSSVQPRIPEVKSNKDTNHCSAPDTLVTNSRPNVRALEDFSEAASDNTWRDSGYQSKSSAELYSSCCSAPGLTATFSDSEDYNSNALQSDTDQSQDRDETDDQIDKNLCYEQIDEVFGDKKEIIVRIELASSHKEYCRQLSRVGPEKSLEEDPVEQERIEEESETESSLASVPCEGWFDEETIKSFEQNSSRPSKITHHAIKPTLLSKSTMLLKNQKTSSIKKSIPQKRFRDEESPILSKFEKILKGSCADQSLHSWTGEGNFKCQTSTSAIPLPRDYINRHMQNRIQSHVVNSIDINSRIQSSYIRTSQYTSSLSTHSSSSHRKYDFSSRRSNDEPNDPYAGFFAGCKKSENKLPKSSSRGLQTSGLDDKLGSGPGPPERSNCTESSLTTSAINPCNKYFSSSSNPMQVNSSTDCSMDENTTGKSSSDVQDSSSVRPINRKTDKQSNNPR